MLNEMFMQQPEWIRVLAALTVVAAAAYVAAEVAARLAREALLPILRPEQGISVPGAVVRRPVRVVRATVFLATAAALALPALDLLGVGMEVGPSSATLGEWFFGSGLRIVVIALVTYVVLRIIATAARRLEEEIGREETPDMVERLRRARTLSGVVQRALTALVIGIAALMMLRELQVDITPILTSAGILGLAVGFGAQTLVKDLISGFFLTFENHVRVGDVATINGTGGLVESINLRTIVLRDLEGVVHVFPNGSIERLANRTKDFSYYVVDVGVSYRQDPDDVIDVLRGVGRELARDPAYSASILEPLDVLGVDAFESSQTVIKVRIKTLPLKQWEVGRELRRRINRTFTARGIDMPFPQMTLSFSDSMLPLQVQVRDDRSPR
jgi:small conductance mechanosensitive channel